MTLAEYGKIFCHLSFWSILGTLSRMSLTKLTNYQGSYIHSADSNSCLWSNFAACFIISAVANSTSFWYELVETETEQVKDTHRAKAKTELLLYVGLTTGYCGSLSTFSSLIVEAFNKALDASRELPNHGYGTMEFASVILVQLGVSVLAWKLGHDLVIGLEQFHAIKMPSSWVAPLEVAIGILGVCLIIVMVVLAAALPGWWRPWAASCCFAPLAVMLRFELARNLNSRSWFPWGTLAANTIACVVIGIALLASRGLRVHNSHAACVALVAIENGFSGVLSTTSTFVAEFEKLQGKRRHIYAFTSVAVCTTCVLLTFGVYAWSTGVRSAICHY
ncbi:unnamed protein product [Kuraishia capsulata CBS 1993]|uniref:Fluoride ion transporter CrcB n=1 Tax=Kuraishia capsulata CBS 1993 TaxID=1382522 RepID=W6MM63_9ASCO|nr:uncharacterized protein KUCA_T00003618001 [Kuraishia capsulata CBS 1993]CDK27639.1 unnamed protein product [Kuraishia capsulata CBS 1993]